MKLYRFLTGPDNDEFCHRISEALSNGWELYGSPALSYNGETVIAGQAITKQVDNELYTENLNLRNY